MSIISQTTWDKFTQEEIDKIKNMFDNFKEYRINMSDEKQEGVCYAIKELFPKEALQPQPLTYEDVARELFKDGLYFIDTNGKATYINRLSPNAIIEPNNCTSEKQAKKLLAINKLLNVARFLNGKDWKPDEADGKLWAIGIEKYNKTIMSVEVGEYDFRTEIVYFRTQQLAEQAIQILGEKTVRLALSSDW